MRVFVAGYECSSVHCFLLCLAGLAPAEERRTAAAGRDGDRHLEEQRQVACVHVAGWSKREVCAWCTRLPLLTHLLRVLLLALLAASHSASPVHFLSAPVPPAPCPPLPRQLSCSSLPPAWRPARFSTQPPLRQPPRTQPRPLLLQLQHRPRLPLPLPLPLLLPPLLLVCRRCVPRALHRSPLRCCSARCARKWPTAARAARRRAGRQAVISKHAVAWRRAASPWR